MTPATRYLRALCIATLVLLFAVAAFNLIVDPYGVFRVVSVEGFNRIKSQAVQRAELFKRVGVARVRPNALILGNSRAEIGFDPESPAWPMDVRPVFNVALPGTGVDSTLDELTQVLASSTPRVVLIGLDFLDFRTDAIAREAPAPAHRSRMQDLRDRASALLTLSALADSIATIEAQHRRNSTSLTEAGFNPMRDYEAIARNEGYYAMFRQRDEENAKAYVRGSKTIFSADGRPAPELHAIEQIIALTTQRGISLRFVIYPYHAHSLVLFDRAGLWPAFEAWKRELVRRSDAAAQGADVELWDFSGFGAFANERVPPPGNTSTAMDWYWEAGHFKKSLGDLVLARVFGRPDTPPQWGVRLIAGKLDAHLQQQRADRDAYERDHASDVSDLAQLVALASARQAPPFAVRGSPFNGQ